MMQREDKSGIGEAAILNMNLLSVYFLTERKSAKNLAFPSKASDTGNNFQAGSICSS